MVRSARLWIGISIVWIPLAFLFDGVTVLVLPLRLGADQTSLGIVSLIGIGIAAGIQPVMGAITDRLRLRIDRRLFLAAAAVPAIAGVVALVSSTSLLAAAIAYIVVQVAAASMQAAQQTLIPEHVPTRDHGRAAGFKAAFDIGGSFVAFLVLGGLLGSGSLRSAAGVIAAAVLIGVLTVWLLVPRAALRAPPAPGRAPLPAGLLSLTLSRFLFLFGTYGVGRFLVGLVAERLALPADRVLDEAGGLLALFTLVTAAAALATGRFTDVGRARRLMISGAAVAATGIIVLVPATGIVGVIAGGCLMALGTGAFVTGNWAATTTLVPRDEAGRLMGVANLGTGLAAAAAGILGPVIDAEGFGPALVLAAAASAAAVIPIAGQGAARAHGREITA